MTGDSRQWFLLALAVGLGWLMYRLAPVITPFAISAALAYMGDPLVDRLQRLRLFKWPVSRTVAVIIVFIRQLCRLRHWQCQVVLDGISGGRLATEDLFKFGKPAFIWATVRSGAALFGASTRGGQYPSLFGSHTPSDEIGNGVGINADDRFHSHTSIV